MEKYEIFNKWLRENGAVFDMVECPSVFEKGLMGIGAKEDIGQYKVST